MQQLPQISSSIFLMLFDGIGGGAQLLCGFSLLSNFHVFHLVLDGTDNAVIIQLLQMFMNVSAFKRLWSSAVRNSVTAVCFMYNVKFSSHFVQSCYAAICCSSMELQGQGQEAQALGQNLLSSYQ